MIGSKKIDNYNIYNIYCPYHIFKMDHLNDRLRRAIVMRDIDGVIQAIDDGADVNGTVPFYRDNRCTLLYKAVGYTNVEIIRYLILKGAIIDTVSGQEEWTPLHYAASIGNIDIVKLLLDHGASIEPKTTHGTSVYDFARGLYDKQLIQYLESYNDIPVKGVYL